MFLRKNKNKSYCFRSSIVSENKINLETDILVFIDADQKIFSKQKKKKF